MIINVYAVPGIFSAISEIKAIFTPENCGIIMQSGAKLRHINQSFPPSVNRYEK